MHDDALSDLNFLFQNIFDIQLSSERKELVIREGVDEALDRQRRLYSSMLELLDERSRETQSLLLQHFPQLDRCEAFSLCGYEFLPRSRCCTHSNTSRLPPRDALRPCPNHWRR